MKRILIFSISYYPFVGGAEVAIKEITDRINDIEFDMITLRFDRSLPSFERVGNVNVYRIGFTSDKPSMADLVRYPLKLNKFLFPFLASRKARELHREKKYDAIWAMMAAFAGFAASFFKKKNPDVPYLLTMQEGDPIDQIKHKVRFCYSAFEKIFTRADYIQTISHYLADFAREMGFRGRLDVVPNAVDVAHFSQEYSVADLDNLKKELGKKDGDVFLIHVGRFVLKNGVDDIIKSLSHLPQNIKLLLLGNGPDELALRALTTDLNLNDRVIFYGFVGHKDLPRFLRVSDVFIRPSLSEGLGNVFLEAMATETPVIATYVGGIPDFLFDPEKTPDQKPTGLICEVRNPESIARQVFRFVSNREERESIVKNAKELVSTKYDWSMIARDMRSIFDKL